MKTTTKTQADLDNDQLDADMTEEDKAWWTEAGRQEEENAGK